MGNLSSRSARDLKSGIFRSARLVADLDLRELSGAVFVGDHEVITIDSRADEGRDTLQVWDVANGALVGELVEIKEKSATKRYSVLDDPFIFVRLDNRDFVWDGDLKWLLADVTGSALGVSGDRKRLLAQLGRGVQNYLVRVARFPQENIDYLLHAIPRCLTRKQLQQYFLDTEPPRWCVTGPDHLAEKDLTKWVGKTAYDTVEWKNWLSAKDRGEKNPTLPKSVD